MHKNRDRVGRNRGEWFITIISCGTDLELCVVKEGRHDAKITTKPEEFLQVHIFGTLCDLWDTPERSAPSQLRCLLQ